MPSLTGNVFGGLAGSLVNNIAGTVASSLFPGAKFAGSGAGVPLGQTIALQDATNRRVSLGPRPAAVARVLGTGLLTPLKGTGNAMMFPYTPTVSYSQAVNYENMAPVHANQDFYVYSRTPAPDITVDGDFTVQNQQEGQYAMACIHFLRTMSKMNFGQTDPNAGTPPPILLFNAYGPFIFNNVPVIVKSFNFSMPNDVDYVQVGLNSASSTSSTPGVSAVPAVTVSPGQAGYNAATMQGPTQISAGIAAVAGKTTLSAGKPFNVWLPSMFKISVTIAPQHTPSVLRTRFNLPNYVNGVYNPNGPNNQSDFI